MRIHLVVNIGWIVQYKEQAEEQRVKEVKPVEIEGVEEWKVEKILNKRKVKRVVKYLVWWKKFMVETWHVGKGERFRECKRSSSRIWEKTEYRSKIIRKVGDDREKRLQKERVTREVYCKNVVWMELL